MTKYPFYVWYERLQHNGCLGYGEKYTNLFRTRAAAATFAADVEYRLGYFAVVCAV